MAKTLLFAHLLSSKPFPALTRGVPLAMIQWRTLPRTSSRPPPRRSARTSWVILQHPTLPTSPLGQTHTVIPLKAVSLRRIISSMLKIIRRWRYSKLCLSSVLVAMPYCSLRDCLNVNLIRHDWQTSRVTDSPLSSTEVTKALKWIIHFAGDIHQPLHDEALGMHVS